MAARRPSVPSQPSPADSKVSIPRLNQDPVQSLRPWPVVVTCLREDLTIPALPAADWLSVLLPEDFQLDDVFPGLLDEETEDWVGEQLLLGHLDGEEFQEIVLAVIETASARKWWVALRLVDVARRQWDILGPELLRYIDADKASLSAWLDVLLVTILRNMDPKDITMFTMRLEAPPDTEDVEPEEMEMDRSAFMALGG